MYLQASRLQYTLQGVVKFQTASPICLFGLIDRESIIPRLDAKHNENSWGDRVIFGKNVKDIAFFDPACYNFINIDAAESG